MPISKSEKLLVEDLKKLLKPLDRDRNKFQIGKKWTVSENFRKFKSLLFPIWCLNPLGLVLRDDLRVRVN